MYFKYKKSNFDIHHNFLKILDHMLHTKIIYYLCYIFGFRKIDARRS